MKEVYHVSDENRNKAEMALKGDDLVSRGSIILKSALSLEIKESGYFIILDASEEALHKAKELLKGLAEKYRKKELVLEKFEEQEEAVISGFGNILGE